MSNNNPGEHPPVPDSITQALARSSRLSSLLELMNENNRYRPQKTLIRTLIDNLQRYSRFGVPLPPYDGVPALWTLIVQAEEILSSSLVREVNAEIDAKVERFRKLQMEVMGVGIKEEVVVKKEEGEG